MKLNQRISEAYRRAREAVTGRVEVDKKTWDKMLAEMDKLREEDLFKDKRIDALVQMVRDAELKAETVRQETYRNVAAGIHDLEIENMNLKMQVRRCDQFVLTKNEIIGRLYRMLVEWLKENGIDPMEYLDDREGDEDGI